MPYTTALFIGFEETSASVGTAGLFGTGYLNWKKPPRVFHPGGIAASDESFASGMSTIANSGRTNSTTGSNLNGCSLGNGQYVSGNRTTFLSATGSNQFAVDRDFWLGTNAAEAYFYFDFKLPQYFFTVPTGSSTTNAAMHVFRWGDVSIVLKAQVYVSTPSTMFTATFSIRNNGTEVATLALPQQSTANWYYAKLRVKLDGSTGLIDFSVNGQSQSVAYSGQNTIPATSVASASWIYCGPPVIDDGATLTVGYLDNWWMGTGDWPPGRPRGEYIAPSSDGTLSGWAAEGTSPTTVVNALSNMNDARAARGTGIGSTALLNLPAVAAAGCEADLIGYIIIPLHVSNRDPVVWKSLSVGITYAGNHTMGTRMASVVLPYDIVTVPPALVYKDGVWEGLWTQSGGLGPFPIATMGQVRLLVG